MRRNKKIPSTYKKSYPFLLFLATLFMGVGYAAVNSISAEISGVALAEANRGVFITAVTSGGSQNAVIENCKVNSSPETTLSTTIELAKTSNAYYLYNVNIVNNTNDRYVYVGALHDNAFYTDANGVYNSSITYGVIGIDDGDILEPTDDKDLQIRFKYSGSDTSQNVLNSYINFVFKKIYSVTYNDMSGTDFPTYAIDGENLVIDVSDADYDNFQVTVGGVNVSNFTYSNKILTIPNVNGDVVITAITNTDGPVEGLPEESDFDIIFHDQGGSNINIAISLTNTTKVDATGWAVYIVVPSDANVTTSWGCSYEIVNNILIITDAGWNGAVAAGATGSWLAGITFSTSDTSYTVSQYAAIMR